VLGLGGGGVSDSMTGQVQERLRVFEKAHEVLREHLRVLRSAMALEPGLALTKLRVITEMLLHHVAAENEVGLPKRPTLETLKGPLKSKGCLPTAVGLHVDTLQMYCNFGAHWREEKPRDSHVIPATWALVGLLEWRYPNTESESAVQSALADDEAWYCVGEDGLRQRTELAALVDRIAKSPAVELSVWFGGMAEVKDWRELPELLVHVGDRLWSEGRQDEAADLYRRLTEAADQPWNARFTALYRLADLLFSRGEFSAVEPLLWEAEALAARELADDVASRATLLSDLASTLKQLDRKLEAVELARRAVGMVPAGEAHALLAAHARAVLSSCLYDARFLDEAERESRLAVEAMQARLGPDDPTTLREAHGHGLILREQGRLDAAFEALSDVLSRKARLLGADDPETLITLSNIAVVERRRGNLERAETLERRALAGLSAAAGPTDRNTLISTYNLALVLEEKGDLGEATRLLKADLAGSREVFGPTHSATAKSAERLSLILFEQGRVEEAAEPLRELLEARRARLGATHPDTLEAQGQLGTALDRMHVDPEAGRLLEDAVNGLRPRPGDDPDALRSRLPALIVLLNNLAANRDRLGKPEESIALWSEALALADQHDSLPNTYLPSLFNLTQALADSDRWSETGPYMERLLPLALAEFGPDDLRTKTVVARAELLHRLRADAERAKAGKTAARAKKQRGRSRRKQAKASRRKNRGKKR